MGKCQLSYKPTSPKSSKSLAKKKDKDKKRKGKDGLIPVLSESPSPVGSQSRTAKSTTSGADAFFATVEKERLRAEQEREEEIVEEARREVEREYQKIMDEEDGEGEGEESDDPLLIDETSYPPSPRVPRVPRVKLGTKSQDRHPGEENWNRGRRAVVPRPSRIPPAPTRIFGSLEELQSQDQNDRYRTIIPSSSSPAGPGPSTSANREKQRQGRVGLSNPNKTALEQTKNTLRRPFVSPVITPLAPASRPVLGWMAEPLEMEQKEKERERTAADDFFDMAKKNPVLPIIEPPEVLDLDDGVGEEPSEAAAAVSALQGVFGLDLDSEDEEGENEEDRLYLDNYRDQDDLCPFCYKPLPILYGRGFQQIHVDIALKIQKHGKESIGVHQQLSYCEAHERDTTIMPLGRRAGYPRKINWGGIWREMEEEWIREGVLEMVRDPGRSRMFKRYFTPEGREGDEPAWGGVWAKATSSERMSAGYYGDIGREIIKAYIFELVEWKYLPLFKHPSRYKPLGPKQFASQILVPEIAVMLIRHRSGLIPSSAGKVSSEQEEQEEEEEAYTKAQRIRKESMQYGRLAFGEMDSGRGADIILEWTKGRSGRKEELELLRPKKGKGRERVKEKEKEDDKGTGKGKDKEKGKGMGRGKQASKGIEVRDKSSVSIVDLTEDAEPIVSPQVVPAEEEEVDELDSESDIELVPSPVPAESKLKNKPDAESVSSHSSPVERLVLTAPRSSLAKGVTPTTQKPASNIKSENNAPIAVSLSDLFSDDEDIIPVKVERKSGEGEKKRKRDCRSESESESSDSTIAAVPATSRIRKGSDSKNRLQAVEATSSTKFTCPGAGISPRSNSNPKSIQRAESWRKSTTPLMSLSQNSIDDYGGDFDISSQELKRLDGIMA